MLIIGTGQNCPKAMPISSGQGTMVCGSMVRRPRHPLEPSRMAKMPLFDRCERPALVCSSCSATSSAWRRCTSRGWWLMRGGWLGFGLVLLGVLAGLAQDAAAQADSRTIEVQVNLPYALQFGLGSYDVGGL